MVITLRQETGGRVYQSGGREVEVTCMSEVLELLELGTLARATADTWMNESSSRSHVQTGIT